jgi:hypothetical protein
MSSTNNLKNNMGFLMIAILAIGAITQISLVATAHALNAYFNCATKKANNNDKFTYGDADKCYDGVFKGAQPYAAEPYQNPDVSAIKVDKPTKATEDEETKATTADESPRSTTVSDEKPEAKSSSTDDEPRSAKTSNEKPESKSESVPNEKSKYPIEPESAKTLKDEPEYATKPKYAIEDPNPASTSEDKKPEAKSSEKPTKGTESATEDESDKVIRPTSKTAEPKSDESSSPTSKTAEPKSDESSSPMATASEPRERASPLSQSEPSKPDVGELLSSSSDFLKSFDNYNSFDLPFTAVIPK